MISDVAPAFQLLIDHAAKSAPDVLEDILFNGDFDIVDAMLVEIEILGQVLVSLNESTSVIKLADLGQMIIGQTQIVKMCHEYLRQLACFRGAPHSATKDNANAD